MADPKIRLKRSSVEGKIPTSDQVPLGEIALNTYDGYLYASRNVGVGTTVIAINPFRVGTGTNTYNAYFTAGNVGIGSEIPTTKLDVDGTVTATSFAGSGANLTGLTGASAATYGGGFVIPVITVDANGRITGISTAANAGASSGSGLSQIADDTTPQLGGNLDVNAKNINFGNSASASDDRLNFGAGTDLSIYHDGTHSYIDVIPDSANQNHLYIRNNVDGDYNSDIFIQAKSGETSIRCYDDSSVELYYDNAAKLTTTSTGFTVTGTGLANAAGGGWKVNDNKYFTAGTGDDFQIYHDGSNSYLDNDTGHIFIRNNVAGDVGGNIYLRPRAAENGIVIYDDNAVELYYDGSAKFQTTSTGVSVTGTGVGNWKANDIHYLTVGTGDDFQIYHNGTHTYLDNDTGNLYIRNNVAGDVNGDIFIMPHDNENGIRIYDDGGVELYYDNASKLQTTATGVTITGALNVTTLDFLDDQKMRFGTGLDAEIYHNGTHTFFDNNTGNLYIRNNVAGDLHGDIFIMPHDNENGIRIYDDGGVELYYDNSSKFQTTSTGFTVTGTGLGNFKANDSSTITAGTGDDFQIYHDGSHTYLDNDTGNLYIRNNVAGDLHGDIFIMPHDNENGIRIYDDGAVELYYDNASKLVTTTTGITVTGTGLADGWKVNDNEYFTAGTGDDFQIYHSGSHTFLDNDTGNLYIRNNVASDVGGNIYLRPHDNEEGIIINDDGEVQLYYDNVEKLNTSSSGITVAGSIGVNVDSPEYDLDFGETSASTIRIVSENTGTAIRIGAGGNGNNDVTLLRVDGNSSEHNGESDNSNYGFSTKYMGTRTGNNNSLSIFSDNQTGTAVEAITINQDGSIGINSTNPTTRLDVDGNANINGSVTATSIVKSGGTSSQFLKADGSVDGSTYLTSYTETDPVVAAINGIVKSDGTTISAATAGTDYLTDISQDTTPQLGGNLDLNSNTINGTGSINITGGASFTGNVTIGGTLTYEDVTNIDSVGLITARSGINVSAGGINVTGVSTFQSNVHLLDDDVLYIGDDNDLMIYETGGDVGINYQTTGGTLFIRGDNIKLDKAGSKRILTHSTGAVDLYYANSKKLETTTDGIIVTGINTADAFAGFDYLKAPHGTTVNYAVTVAAKTAAHRYNGSGSSNGYLIDGVESPFLTFTPGRTYRFTLSSSDMTSHPFRFYLEADKTTAYTTNVTSTATYTEIVVTDTTPTVLHYQCSAHGYMGNAVQVNSNKVDTPYQIDGLKGANITGVTTSTSFVKSSNSGGFLKADGTEDTNTYLTSLGTAIVDGDFTSNGFMKRTGAGTYAVDSNTYLTSYTETDPVVGAISGIVKADGGGNISAATAGTDYLTPSGDGSGLTGLTGASAATYGSAGATPVIVVDSDGRITGISTVATSGGGGGGSVSEAFKTIAVSGQSDVVADGATDTLTLVAGSNMTITTNASGDSITFASSGGGGGSSSTRTVNRYVATQSQTLFPASGTISYSVGYLDVYLNGSRLDTTEFTATNGTTVTLGTGASANDVVELVAFTNVSLTNVTVVNDTSPQLGGNLDLNSNNITGTGNINITGTATVSGSQVATQNDAIAFAIALG